MFSITLLASHLKLFLVHDHREVVLWFWNGRGWQMNFLEQERIPCSKVIACHPICSKLSLRIAGCNSTATEINDEIGKHWKQEMVALETFHTQGIQTTGTTTLLTIWGCCCLQTNALKGPGAHAHKCGSRNQSFPLPLEPQLFFFSQASLLNYVSIFATLTKTLHQRAPFNSEK